MTIDSRFDDLDQKIDDLADRIAGCTQTIVISRAAIGLGAVALLAALLFYAYRTPPVILASLAAMIGGTVWGGSSGATRDGLKADLTAAEDEKARLIDEVADRNGWRDLTPTVH